MLGPRRPYYEIGCTIDSFNAPSTQWDCFEYLTTSIKSWRPNDDAGHVRMELIIYNEDMTGPSSSQTVRDSVIRQIRYGIASHRPPVPSPPRWARWIFIYHGSAMTIQRRALGDILWQQLHCSSFRPTRRAAL